MAVAVGGGHAKPPTTITTTCAKLRIKMRPIMEEGYEKKKKKRSKQKNEKLMNTTSLLQPTGKKKAESY